MECVLAGWPAGRLTPWMVSCAMLSRVRVGANTGDFPRFVLKAWDKDWIDADELIGSVELPDAIGLFRQAWRARVSLSRRI